MSLYRFCLPFIICLFLLVTGSATGQNWELIKEKEGIKIYTRKSDGETLKSYKGVCDVKAPADRVFGLIEDVNNTDWWDKNLSNIRVLRYEKNKLAQYYLVYDLPWPVTDRDLCVDVTVTIDPASGVRKITAVPLPGVIPENQQMIRIKDYRQTWTIQPAGKETSHVELEGYIDPAGSIPDWITNMLIVDSPLKVIEEVRKRTEKNGR
jgi:hypothetical protein